MLIHTLQWLSFVAVAACPGLGPMEWSDESLQMQELNQVHTVRGPADQLDPDHLLASANCLGSPTAASQTNGQRFWQLLNPQSVPAGQSWGLSVPVTGYRDLCVFWPARAGGWQSRCAGPAPDGLPEAQSQRQSIFIAPTALDPTRPVLVTAESPFFGAFPVKTGPADLLVAEQTRNTLLQGLVYGTLLALVIYGLLLLGNIRSLGLLHFSAYIGFFTASLFLGEHLHVQWLGIGTHAWQVHGVFFCLALAFAAGTLFLAHFFRHAESAPWIDVVLWGTGILASGLLVMAGLMPDRALLLSEAGALLFAFGGLLLTGAGVSQGRQNAGPLLMGFIFLMLALMVNGLFRLGWLPNPGLSSFDVLKLGLLAGGLSLGLAIQWEFSNLRRQRDRASLLAETHQRIARHRAEFDATTGLPGRNRFFQLVSERVASTRGPRHGQGLGLLVVDIDGFRRLRHLHGQALSDNMLHALVARLQTLEIGGRVLGRTESDEFSMLLPLPGGQSAAESLLAGVAREIAEQVGEPLQVEGHDVRLTASVGGSLYPHIANGSDNLVRQAEAAVFEARESGGNRFALFGQSEGPGLMERWEMRNRLADAIENDQLSIHFQPILSLTNKRICYLEVLARWHDERLGPVPPSTFIGVAESFGLIDALTRSVIEQACVQAVAWQRQGILNQVGLSLNLSPLQLRDHAFEEGLMHCLKSHGLRPDQICLELTENTLVENLDQARWRLQSLSRRGFKISVDDFGVGYSSLSYIRELPIDTIKIDRSFLSRLDQSSAEQEIVRSILEMARKLGLTVVAEGIETRTQAEFLRRHACQYGQGFLFSRPEPAEAITRRLRRESPIPRPATAD
ncbi:diguanylate cyclase (GGDEF)-like protein [Natronospira proteinivora]|uniref:Diguanylate cyclase (GGDEF)-like protein n=1 Tax=Natronospira proteinivora TaxID=1807133 RepID=A0ABT1GAB8_9GAMM|nr:EAL domain-containing protein [Natronospira proteinivora]MCP1728270.1 diguanylate cyclase (GGDEF)-like protein [Natronospira proteinivora]